MTSLTTSLFHYRFSASNFAKEGQSFTGLLLKCQFMLFPIKTALRKRFPWQQGKVYSQSFDSAMLPVNTEVTSLSFKKISFVVLELLRKTLEGR